MTRRILLVEDYDDLRIGLQMILEMRGCDVLAAADGHEAVEMFETLANRGETVDEAILDYNLPGFKGDIVADKIKEIAHKAHLPPPHFIGMTGSEDAHMVGRFRESGVVDLILKGGAKEPIDRIVDRIIGKQMAA